MKKIVAQQRIRDAFEKQGEEVVDSEPEAYDKLTKSEYERYVRLVKDVGMKTQ